MIVRSHVAFGGEDIVVIGAEPWQFKKRAQAFSRRLEKICNFIYLRDESSFFEWSMNASVVPIAIEIDRNATMLSEYAFPTRLALVIGNERFGLSASFLAQCAATVTIPQFGPVGSLNAAISASIAMYEVTRHSDTRRQIVGTKYWVDAAERP
jgi:tRNA G18 (ribose-2'-O)-methylase SpoU